MINKKNMLSIIGLILLVLAIVSCNLYPNNPPDPSDEDPTETTTEEKPVFKTAEVVINEVNTQGNHPEAETDFIELYNTTTGDITLENDRWFITDSKSDPNDSEADLSLFKAISGTIGAKGYLVILCGIEGSVEENVVDFSLDSNEGVYLYYRDDNASFTLIDSAEWTEHQNSGGSVPDGSVNWVPVNISPGARNVDLAVPTPEVAIPNIVINEINTFGDDFIELYNRDSTEFTLTSDKWFITDDDSYPNPDPAVLQSISGTSTADGFFVIICDSNLSEGDGSTTVNFGLGNNEQLYLYYKNDDDSYAPITSVKWTEHQASGGLVPDGIGDWTYPITATAGSSNNDAAPTPVPTPDPSIADIVINEIHTPVYVNIDVIVL